MNEDERAARYEAQTKEQFEALGRFVQAFEQMVEAARFGLSHRLQCESQNLFYFTSMLFHHKALTAGPLFELFRGFIMVDVLEIKKLPEVQAGAYREAMRDIGREYMALVEFRNLILHGTPYIGWAGAEQEDFSELAIHKGGVDKNGFKEHETPKSAAAILTLCGQCDKVTEAIRWVTISMGFAPDRERMLEKVKALLSD